MSFSGMQEFFCKKDHKSSDDAIQKKIWYLYCLSEELGEVIQAIGKCRRYGSLTIKTPERAEPNYSFFKMEIHDCIAIYEELTSSMVVIINGEDYKKKNRLTNIEMSYRHINERIGDFQTTLEDFIEICSRSNSLRAFFEENQEVHIYFSNSFLDIIKAYACIMDYVAIGEVRLSRDLIDAKKSKLNYWYEYSKASTGA